MVIFSQPPLRGCVLKRPFNNTNGHLTLAAASARLCVETIRTPHRKCSRYAAASARLCVETTIEKL